MAVSHLQLYLMTWIMKVAVWACYVLLSIIWNQSTAVHMFNSSAFQHCAVQFKNRYTLINLCFMDEDYGVTGTWAFCASSHSKRTVDAVGGSQEKCMETVEIKERNCQRCCYLLQGNKSSRAREMSRLYMTLTFDLSRPRYHKWDSGNRQPIYLTSIDTNPSSRAIFKKFRTNTMQPWPLTFQGEAGANVTNQQPICGFV